jgi:polyisoprenoid-binding protein YceI
MKLSHLTTSILAITALTLSAGCSAQVNADSAKVAQKVDDHSDHDHDGKKAKAAMQGQKPSAPGADISGVAAGTYKSEDGHAYITFQYMHQGYSRPTIRWNDFEAAVTLDPSDPTASTLSVTIDAASVDSGIVKFDTHMKSGDMFDVEKFPTITFTSTSLNQATTATGQLVGELTMKGITKPVELAVTLNKIGETRDKTPMFGISAKTQIKRSDWDLGYAVPYVGDDVTIIIEVEFVKAG